MFGRGTPDVSRASLCVSWYVAIAALLLCLLAPARPAHAAPDDVTIITDTTIDYALPNFLFVQNSATVSLITGASVAGNLEASGGTTVNIAGASLAHDIVARGATINLSGGSIGGRLFASKGTTVNISGGSIGDYLAIEDTSTVNVYGTGLSLLPPSPGQQDYTLTGTLKDGTAINTPIRLYGSAAITQVHLFNTDPFLSLREKVVALGTSGVLNAGNTNALLVKLNAAEAALARGNKQAARGSVGAFINQVNAFVRTGKLTSAQGAALLADAQTILSKTG